MSNKNLNILFLGGAKRVSLAERFIKEGKNININLKIFSYELENNPPISFTANIILGLKWDDKNIFRHLQKVTTENNINIIIPFLDFSTIIAAKMKQMEEFKNIFIPVSSLEFCEIFFDKKKANNWCINNNIKIPSNKTNEFPLVAKPIKGSASKGIIIIKNSFDFKNLIERKKYLIQKFISGIEYTIDVYRSTLNNQIISIIPRKRLETQGGESIKSITSYEPDIINFSKDIIEKTDLIGPITIQIIKENKTNEIYYMEINPRYGGAVLNSIEAGANSPKYIINEYFKIKNSKIENWTDRLLMIRRFSENYIICK